MAEETIHTMELSDLEYKLVIASLKMWRGDFRCDPNSAEMWNREITALLKRHGEEQIGWKNQ